MALPRVPASMEGLVEGIVWNSKHQAYQEQDEDDDPSHPGEGDQGDEQPTGFVLATESQVSPERLQYYV